MKKARVIFSHSIYKNFSEEVTGISCSLFRTIITTFALSTLLKTSPKVHSPRYPFLGTNLLDLMEFNRSLIEHSHSDQRAGTKNAEYRSYCSPRLAILSDF